MSRAAHSIPSAIIAAVIVALGLLVRPARLLADNEDERHPAWGRLVDRASHACRCRLDIAHWLPASRNPAWAGRGVHACGCRSHLLCILRAAAPLRPRPPSLATSLWSLTRLLSSYTARAWITHRSGRTLSSRVRRDAAIPKGTLLYRPWSARTLVLRPQTPARSRRPEYGNSWSGPDRPALPPAEFRRHKCKVEHRACETGTSRRSR